MYFQNGKTVNDMKTGIELIAEERPEPYTGKYDEAYIQEKIEKATKSWEGVDVDKYMDEVRGRGEKDTPELDGEAEEWAECRL